MAKRLGLGGLLILANTLIAAVRACASDGDYSIKTPSDFPLVSPDDTIDVLFLRAPLLEAAHGDLMGAIKGFHSGVGFRSHANRTTWQFEFDAINFIGAVIPEVKDGEVIWNNTAEVCARDEIRYTYWQVGTSVATITGAEYNQMQHVIGWYAHNNSVYQGLTVVRSDGTESLMHRSNTCSDFTWTFFMALKQLIGPDRFQPAVLPITTQFTLLADDNINPVKVSAQDPEHKRSIADFFQKFANIQSDLQHKVSKLREAWDSFRLWMEIRKHVFYVLDQSDTSRQTYLLVHLNKTSSMRSEAVDPYHIFSAPGMKKVVWNGYDFLSKDPSVLGEL